MDVIGQKYGRYTVLSEAERAKRLRRVLCRCDCGTERVVLLGSLRSGHTKSCGCLRDELATEQGRTHGHSWTPTWKIWIGMLARCSEKARGVSAARYFERGIRVCERWRSFENFLADMGERPDGMQIDRIDNDGNYEPGNCRWATQRQNCRNRRTNRMLTMHGETLSMAEWADRTGMSMFTIATRLSRGWPVERALKAKPRKLNRPAK